MQQIVGNEFRLGEIPDHYNLLITIFFLLCRYVLNAYEYDDSVFQGPPRNLPRDEVFNLFGKLLLSPLIVVILVVQSPKLLKS